MKRKMKQDSKNIMSEAKTSPGTSEEERQYCTHETTVLQEFEAQIKEVIDRIGKPYDSKTEVAPSLAAYHSSFKLAENACVKIATDAVQRFKDSDFADAETKQIVADFEEKGKIAYNRSNQRIGLIGDSGVGKSLPLCKKSSDIKLPQEKVR